MSGTAGSATGRAVAGSASARPPLGDATRRINNSMPVIPTRRKAHVDESSITSRPEPIASDGGGGYHKQQQQQEPQQEPQQQQSQQSQQQSTASTASTTRHRSAAPADPQRPTADEQADAYDAAQPDGLDLELAPAPVDDSPAPKPRRTKFESKQTVPSGPNAVFGTTAAPDDYKRYVGPWQLGKTLGRGSSARVRLCRHRHTRESAAVKIINKRVASLIPDSSMAALNYLDMSLPERIDGEMRIPVAVEREVAILKLMDHPNIVKLYDIWENRSDIYLVLEYVDGGDLFTFLMDHSPLHEQHVMFFYRQIMSAIGFCHDFNICHRDLKPENILLTSHGHVKIADFGMAALHQTEDHHLGTFCGSPHYAAPELLSSRTYRGDRADVWSLGVILFAMLTASLPFNNEDQAVMISMAKRGIYKIPGYVSSAGRDMLRRMIRVSPSQRITVAQMWDHPLVTKYDFLDSLGHTRGRIPGMKSRSELHHSPPVVPAARADEQLLRQLRSMYHMFDADELRARLASSRPNDQKVFYWLLHDYRERQLENFNPNQLVHSASDYHHLKPEAWLNKATAASATCKFVTERPGRAASISRFTVISNNPPESEESYDPYKASRVPLQPRPSQIKQTRVVVHGQSELPQTSQDQSQAVSRRNTGSTTATTRRGTRVGGNSHRASSQQSQRTSVYPAHSPSRLSAHSTQSAGTSSTTRQYSQHHHQRSSSYTRVAPRRRALDGSGPYGQNGHNYQHHSLQAARRRSRPRPGTGTAAAAATVPGSEVVVASPEKASKAPPQPAVSTQARRVTLNVIKPKDPHGCIRDEIRHFSSDITRDIERAFNNNTLIQDESLTLLDSAAILGGRLKTSLNLGTAWENRPLPPLPPASPEEEIRDVEGDGLGARFSVPGPSDERRVFSAPSGPVHSAAAAAASAMTTDVVGRSDTRDRIASAPAHYQTDYFTNVTGNTIRVVISPTHSPVRQPLPLKVGKNRVATTTMSGTHSDAAELAGGSMVGGGGSSGGGGNSGNAASAASATAATAASKKKVGFWFRRAGKDEEAGNDDAAEELPGQAQPQQRKDKGKARASVTAMPGRSGSGSTIATAASAATVASAITAATKKKSFGFLFWKNNSNDTPKMSIESENDSNTPNRSASAKTVASDSSTTAVVPSATDGRTSTTSWYDTNGDGAESRNIEVRQSWLARLFHIKPATSHLCFVISRKRARQEIAVLLREWRRYGMRDVQVDKDRNIVFARVGPQNYLQLKEVSFAAEVMTVVEHGKRNHLSIVRFTQERGAASSFNKVIDTMRLVFETRHLLVAEKKKAKRMIKTLNAVYM